MRTKPAVTTDNAGFLLAKASQRFNELLVAGLAAKGFPEVRPSYGSVLVPLFTAGDLRLGEIAGQARLSKQALTGLVALCEKDGLVIRERDPDDGRAFRISLTPRGRLLQQAAEATLAELDGEIVAELGAHRRDALIEALKGVMDLCEARP
jgi:DNA-binding MarR family transcriptional regulator